MSKLIKKSKNYKRHYYLVKEENRFAVIWKPIEVRTKSLYHGRYLDDPEYDLHMFFEDELFKPKITLKLLWLIIKFRIYDWKERH